MRARRSRWAPEVELAADYSNRLGASGAGVDVLPDDDGWQVGIEARYPLFAGGRRTAELREAEQAFQAVQILHDASAEQIEASIRTGRE